MQPIHSTLCPSSGAPLETVLLSDRQRLAVVLQGSALLAHLQGAGWHLPEGWAGARVGAGGRLGGVTARPGRLGPVQGLLRDLLVRCFGAAGVRGRGEGRRAARALESAWALDLAPIPADEAVAQVLGSAPFLWDPAFADARSALAGERLVAVAPDAPLERRLWLAGSGAFRRRVLARVRDLASLEALLGGPEARDLWHDPTALGEPHELVASGRFRAAVSVWERHPPQLAADRLAFARALDTLGRFERALEVLGQDRALEARVLRARCQLRLGRLGATVAALRRLETVPLPRELTLELADLATRVFANTGEADAAARWVERALAMADREGAGGPDGALAARAALIAAVAAWDRGDREAARGYLAKADGVEGDPRDAWRRYQAHGLVALADGRAGQAAERFAAALRSGRRGLPRFEAGGLWNDLGIARAASDDLAGAERAFLHVHRLLAGCDGPRRTTLALYNLAEVRLRRGRLAGVREILEASAAENRRAGNLRGQIQDAELQARLDLARGRPEAALARIEAARALLGRSGGDWRSPELAVLAARALGWLGRAEEAAAELEGASDRADGLLEPEEIPALFALAGERDRALAAASGTPWFELFAAALLGARGEAGQEPEADASVLDRLEPARAARLVFDLESIATNSFRRRSDGMEIVPPARRRRAAEILRRQGAARFAEWLEARDRGPWVALECWLLNERTSATDPLALESLFVAFGIPEARLILTAGKRRAGLEDVIEPRILVAGVGGVAELSGACGQGLLILGVARLDEPVAALFALLCRELSPPSEERMPQRTSASVPRPPGQPTGKSPGRPAGWIGESPALLAVFERIVRLAPGDLAILVLGQSGTGKELAAREIHRRSPRHRGPYVPVNCAALSETLLLSDLFGHARGAFTGADRERLGVFETAQGGTVFLDEIGDLPPVAQGMLLRVLQEGEIRRLGESLSRKVDVRVVAATHRDLAQAVALGTFRQDLFFRLRGASVTLPPLSERGEDVALLAAHLIEKEANRSGFERAPFLGAAATTRLVQHRWPGNVRELENVIRVACLLAGDGGEILPEHLEIEAEPEAAPVGAYHRQVDEVRRRLVRDALVASGGQRTGAARVLGLSRQALSYLVRELRLDDF